MINPDRGDRYLETVYNHEWLKSQGLGILEEAELERAVESISPVFVRSGARREPNEYASA